MSTDASAMMRAHAITWQYRARLADRWPTPNRTDSLRFAYTEAGEALDAWLRTNPQYARNNHRNMSVPDELADCAMMLCTAMPEHYRFTSIWLEAEFVLTLDGICFAVAEAMLTSDMITPLLMIAQYLRLEHGASLPVLVEQRLQRIERKVTEAQR